jgi:hypothetical protein
MEIEVGTGRSGSGPGTANHWICMGTSTLGLFNWLIQYWNKERREHMFRAATPDLSPDTAVICDDTALPSNSAYEQKIAVPKPSIPEMKEPAKIEQSTLTITTTPTLPWQHAKHIILVGIRCVYQIYGVSTVLVHGDSRNNVCCCPLT